MPDDLVTREDAGGVATLTLNDPARLDALPAEEEIRVLGLRGAGLLRRPRPARDVGRARCRPREMSAARQSPDAGHGFHAALFARCGRVMTAPPRLPPPVIAEAHGVAVAAKLGVAVTSARASFTPARSSAPADAAPRTERAGSA